MHNESIRTIPNDSPNDSSPQQFKELMAGSTIIHLYQKDIVKFNFYVPPTKEEQDAISATIIDMENEISFLRSKLKKYRDIKQGMMQKLQTGEIRLV